jgi:type II secretory pathway component PulF
MPQFEYKAKQQGGKTLIGTIEAVDRRQAVQRLREQKLRPISLREVSASKYKNSVLSWLSDKTKSLKSQKTEIEDDKLKATQSGGTPKREKAGLSFLNRLLELHASGLPIGDSIRILSQRLSNPEQKKLAATLWRELREGATFAGALTRQPRYFSNSIAYVIEAGEATGNLAPILQKVINFLEEKQAIRQKMLASMAYPGFICTVAFVVVIIFLTVLLPQIQKMLDRLGGEMTWSAQLLIDGSDFLIRFGPFVLVAFILSAIGLNQWRKTTQGREKSDKWALKIPLIGNIIIYADLFQSGNLIGTLLESGINTTEVMRLTERTLKNTDLRNRFSTARSQINEGLSVARAFKRNQFMPDLAIDILAVGEDTGNLVHSINEVTKGFRQELTRRLDLLTNLVASGALICAFLMVALIAIGIVTSVFQVSKTLSV